LIALYIPNNLHPLLVEVNLLAVIHLR